MYWLLLLLVNRQQAIQYKLQVISVPKHDAKRRNVYSRQNCTLFIIGRGWAVSLTLRSFRYAFYWQQSTGLDVVAKGVIHVSPLDYNIDIWRAGKPH
jgi:hypothetical protein